MLDDLGEHLDQYLLRPDLLPIHLGEDTAKSWPRTPRPERLLQAEIRNTDSTLKVDRDLATGL